MLHRWFDDFKRLTERVETCQRPGCTAERKPNTGPTSRKHHFLHRTDPKAEWSTEKVVCTGGSFGNDNHLPSRHAGYRQRVV